MAGVRNCSYDWIITSVPDENYFLNIKVSDENAESFDASNGSFEIFTPAPVPVEDLNIDSTETTTNDYNVFSGNNSVEVNVIAYLMIFLSLFGIVASLILYLGKYNRRDV